jgi:hypothetical protein
LVKPYNFIFFQTSKENTGENLAPTRSGGKPSQLRFGLEKRAVHALELRAFFVALAVGLATLVSMNAPTFSGAYHSAARRRGL